MMRDPPEFLSSVKRRSKLEIYIDVLRIIGRGINKPTRIMFAANLSWRTFKEVIAELEKRGLVECKTIEDYKRIFITDKGKRILKNLETLILPAAPLRTPTISTITQ